MKKLLSCVFLILVSVVSHAQCSIRGTASPTVGSTATFSVPLLAPGPCADCYYWTVTGVASITGSRTQSGVSVAVNSAGTFTVSVTYFLNGECYTCTTTRTATTGTGGCNFQVGIVQGFLSTTNSNPPTVTIQATTTPGNLTGVQYNWMVTYQNGSTGGFSSTTSQLATFIATQANPIVSSQVIAYYQGCSSTYTRNYPFPIYGNPPMGGGLGKEGQFTGQAEKFIVAPNPIATNLSFSTDIADTSAYSVSVYDLNGREVVSKAAVGKEIPFGSQVQGIYQFVITGPDGYRQEGKVVKE